MSVFFILLMVLSFILLLLCWHHYKCVIYWKSQGIPCMEAYWLWQNLNESSCHDLCRKLYNKFKHSGPFVNLQLIYKSAIFILDLKLIKYILITDFKYFSDRGCYTNEQDDPLTGQLIVIDGQKWKNLRQKLTPAFTTGKLKSMFGLICDIGNGQLMEAFETARNRNDNIVEIKDLCARFAMDVIGSCAFGIKLNSLRNENVIFLKTFRKSMKVFRHHKFILLLATAFPQLARKLHIKVYPDDTIAFYMNLVAETIKLRENDKIQRGDLMDSLIDLKSKKLIKSVHGEDLTNLSLEEITAQVCAFFNAGFDTSSNTLTMALYELSQHEDVQDKARNEIEEVFGRYNHTISYECLKELKYLEQIILETLRLHTILAFLNRKALQDYHVPDRPGCVFKKGTNIFIPAYAIHMDAEYYPLPEKFIPERFNTDSIAQRDPCLYLAFGEGSRNCIGLRFGKMQIKLALALLLKTYKFSICRETPMPVKFDTKNLLLNIESDVYLKIEKC